MPRAPGVCSAAVFLSGGLGEEPDSGCSGPASAYSGGFSYGGLHPQSCTSSESGQETEERGSTWIKQARHSGWCTHTRSLGQL